MEKLEFVSIVEFFVSGTIIDNKKYKFRISKVNNPYIFNLFFRWVEIYKFFNIQNSIFFNLIFIKKNFNLLKISLKILLKYIKNKHVIQIFKNNS